MQAGLLEAGKSQQITACLTKAERTQSSQASKLEIKVSMQRRHLRYHGLESHTKPAYILLLHCFAVAVAVAAGRPLAIRIEAIQSADEE